ncbi:hypothetical protein XarbCFBP8150_21625, partial [Xanthomonas arboricola]|uniref:hypothetical protein n=1 Tax=Xanthomonas arboricola TaxID=56448 RepID=UPI000D4E6E51
GSLGATVDLRTARPFDYNGFTFAASGQAAYNAMAEKANPRVAAGGEGEAVVVERARGTQVDGGAERA